MNPKKPLPISPLKLIHDEPIRWLEQDWLELQDRARVVADVALGTEGPFTIGVFGQWGMGKTSILQLAQKLVDESEDAKTGAITTVVFNAWQYEQERAPLIPLVATILQALEKNKSDRLNKFRDALRSVLYGLSVKFAAKNPLIGDAGISLDSAKAIDQYEKLRSNWIDRQIDQCLYYKAFQMIKDSQDETDQQKPHKIVVFIDDLDRCFPNKAVRLLESIKLVLAQKELIFVLAVDHQVLESYLDQRFRNIFGLDGYHQGQSYLDKLIQLPLWIPPHKQRFEPLVADLLKTYPLEDKPSDLASRTKTIGFACNHNPRQLTRFLNNLLVEKQLFDYSNDNPENVFPLDGFIVSLGIRHQSESVYQWLISRKDTCDRLKDATDVKSMRELIKGRLKELEKHATPDMEEQREMSFLRKILGHDSILNLLASKEGNAWLYQKPLRDKIDNFLDEKRESAQWVQEQIEEALNLLSSNDEKEIIWGLHVLYAYPKAPKAVDDIAKLTKNRNANIAGLAQKVIEKINALESKI